MEVQIALFDGFDELDAIGPYEVFQNAAWAGAALSVSLCSHDGSDVVTASHGLGVETDAMLAADRPDVVLVPGGGWNEQRQGGTWTEAERGELPSLLGQLHDDGATVAAVSTGAMLLAHAGLLGDRPATTHPGAVDDLHETAADVVDARVVDDGDVLTAGGATAGLDLATYLVEREFGESLAGAVTREMVYERRGAVHRSTNGN